VLDVPAADEVSGRLALGALLMAFDFVLKLRPLLAPDKVADEVRQ
jgi:hypothetical protein